MLSARLRSLRKEKKLTQEQVAKSIGIKRERYSSYEGERAEPSNEILSKIADFYETTTEYLMGRTDDREKVDKIRSDVTSSTPDLNKILRETAPHWNGKPLTKRDADMIIDFYEAVLKYNKIDEEES